MPIENQSVRDYLLKRKAERDALEGQVKEESSGPNIAAALGAIGAGFQGKDSLAAGQSILERQKKGRDQKISDFDKGTDSFIRDTEAINMADKVDRERSILAAEDDVNSEESKLATQLAQRMGYKGGPISATKFKTFSPSLQKMYEIEQEKLDRNFQRKTAADLKKTEKESKLSTPFGLANTEDDAKKLKEAYEAKTGFDNKLQQMIELRQKHGGGAIMNREDVARGKQLAQDLLLDYKDMAKLGVLSAADEAIIRDIIPKDPLQYNSPLAAIQGQDPTLNRLKAFQNDSNKDFETRLSTRLQGGAATKRPPGTEFVKVQAPDGSIRNVPKDKLQAALNNGGKLVGNVAGGSSGGF